MKSIYNKTSNTLREQQWVVKTSSYQGDGETWFSNEKEAMDKYYEWYKYEGQLQVHVDKPQFIKKEPIPCSANNWKDGQELEEGKDYDVDKQFLDDNDVWQSLKEFPSAYDNFKDEYRRLFAIPIVQETESDLQKAIILLEKAFLKAKEPLATEIYNFIQRRKQ